MRALFGLFASVVVSGTLLILAGTMIPWLVRVIDQLHI